VKPAVLGRNRPAWLRAPVDQRCAEHRGVRLALDSGVFPALAKVGVQLLAYDSFDSRFTYGIDRLLHLA
jgi:hypothetical protein